MDHSLQWSRRTGVSRGHCPGSGEHVDEAGTPRRRRRGVVTMPPSVAHSLQPEPSRWRAQRVPSRRGRTRRSGRGRQTRTPGPSPVLGGSGCGGGGTGRRTTWAGGTGRRGRSTPGRRRTRTRRPGATRAPRASIRRRRQEQRSATWSDDPACRVEPWTRLPLARSSRPCADGHLLVVAAPSTMTPRRGRARCDCRRPPSPGFDDPLVRGRVVSSIAAGLGEPGAVNRQQCSDWDGTPMPLRSLFHNSHGAPAASDGRMRRSSRRARRADERLGRRVDVGDLPASLATARPMHCTPYWRPFAVEQHVARPEALDARRPREPPPGPGAELRQRFGGPRPRAEAQSRTAPARS